MFSSRNIKFAAEIMRETAGRGVDVVINSLVGELLDASWRIVADGGTMVEIGKKDIVDRNTLAMEPFDRNCSFRAIDFSYTKHINGPMVAKYISTIIGDQAQYANRLKGYSLSYSTYFMEASSNLSLLLQLSASILFRPL